MHMMPLLAAALLTLLTGWRGFFAWYPTPMSVPNGSIANYLLIVALLPVFPLAIARYVEGRCLASHDEQAAPLDTKAAFDPDH